MIHPKTLLKEWVAAFQKLPNLVEALGGDASQIQYYSENTVVFGEPTQNNVRLALLSMPPGSIMIAWQGSGPGRMGNMLVFVHDFSLYLKAPENADVGYEDLFHWIVNDVPTDGTLRMLHTPVDAVFLKSPQGDEIREVEATAEALSPLLSKGWNQVPAPASHDTVTLASAREGE